MYVWRLWGDVWVVDRDPLTMIIGNILVFCFLVALTLAVLALWLPFMGVKWAWGQLTTTSSVAVSSPGSYSALPGHEPSAVPDACPNCGNTASRDIRPCIRCGH